jgi:hypothetical protein
VRGGARAQSGVELRRGERFESAYLEFALGREGRAVSQNARATAVGGSEALSDKVAAGERLKPEPEGNGCWAAGSLQHLVLGQGSPRSSRGTSFPWDE